MHAVPLFVFVLSLNKDVCSHTHGVSPDVSLFSSVDEMPKVCFLCFEVARQAVLHKNFVVSRGFDKFSDTI